MNDIKLTIVDTEHGKKAHVDDTDVFAMSTDLLSAFGLYFLIRLEDLTESIIFNGKSIKTSQELAIELNECLEKLGISDPVISKYDKDDPIVFERFLPALNQKYD